MPSVRLKEREDPEYALRRFKRACEKAGILTELRKREVFVKPSKERQRARAAARKRHLKRLMKEAPIKFRTRVRRGKPDTRR